MDKCANSHTDILLESGTNELEILEFEVGNSVYGINVAKVVEITTAKEITPIPQSSDVVEGIIISRGEVVSVVDLFKVLNSDRDTDPSARDMFITCCFNQITTAFHAGRVRSIRRIFWSDIKEPPRIANTSKSDSIGLLTGIIQTDDGLVLILDFEKIVASINRETGIVNSGHRSTSKKIKDCYIVVADDSVFLNKMIVESLGQAGFTNIDSFKNGAETLDYVMANKGKDIACIVSDIEMPQLDGLALTKRLKSNPDLCNIPIFLFSSLINEQMIAKCKSVGADRYFSKPQIGSLIDELIQLLEEEQ